MYLKAWRSLLRLRNTPLQAARDLFYISYCLEQEDKAMEAAGLDAASSMFTRFIEMFKIPRIRRASWAAVIVMIGQQLCGSKLIICKRIPDF